MNIKKDRRLIEEAIKQGCTTVAELAHFVKVYALVARSCQRIE